MSSLTVGKYEDVTITEIAIPLCPNCLEDSAVYCQECGNDYVGCDCLDDPCSWWCMRCSEDFYIDIKTGEIPHSSNDFFQDKDGRWYWSDGTEAKCYCYSPKTLICNSCNVSRPTASAFWNPWIEFDSAEPNKSVTPTVTSWTNTGGWGAWNSGAWTDKCRHLSQEVKLKTVTILASSLNDQRSDDIPDFGLYADWSWNPWWRNEHVDWQDFGLPTDYETAYDQISDAFDKAKAGKIIEIGCIGGHGRTGTILACMAVLDGFTPKEAVIHIEKNYCDQVIETLDQEWFVSWVEARFLGYEVPTKPVRVSSYADVCTSMSHLAMLKANLTKCKKEDCKTFMLDLDRYLNGWDTTEAMRKRYGYGPAPTPTAPHIATIEVKPTTASPATIKEIAQELQNELALPAPAVNRKFLIGQVKDGFVMTKDGWEPLYDESGNIAITSQLPARKKKNKKRNRKRNL